MSGFIESLSNFLTARRNNILDEVCRNNPYTDLKNEILGLSERLLATVAPELKSTIIDFLDDFTATSSFETKYCYLCGLRDGNKPDNEINWTDDTAPDVLAMHKEYIRLKKTAATRYKELQECLDAESRVLIDEYKRIKETMIGIEKNSCYTEGRLDRKRLDNQFDPSAKKNWQDLWEAFL